jgi:Holliday junction DNA helicase RuvA
MIGKLTGRFAGMAGEGLALVEVGGVGYAVRVPAEALLLMPSTNTVSLFIHTAVREDAIDLYGFPTPEELNFFKLLCSVSGIGPKTAMGICNVADPSTLARAIARGDASALTKIFGIGKKSAERIVVELRDKMNDTIKNTSALGATNKNDDTDVLEALMALGYSAGESRTALKEVRPDIIEMRARLSAALQYLGGSRAPTRTT